MTQAPIYFDNEFIELQKWITENSNQKFFFLTDESTHEYCLPLLLSELSDDLDIEILECPAGEESKSLEIAYQLWSAMSDLGADRNSILINCGGGVVTDLGGFLASTYKRGIRFVNIPTSLLSMVDASVGGKTGIDLSGIKNIIGTFAQPEMVYINTDFLETLPQKELRSGFAEMLKHGLIANAQHWQNLIAMRSLQTEQIATHIQSSVEIKRTVVEKDPTEKGLRKILNVGHTLGHAVETYQLNNGMPILHGDAVAIGILLESYMAEQIGWLQPSEREKTWKGILQFFDPISLPPFKELLPILKHDKKNENGKIAFSLLTKIGHASEEMYYGTEDEIKQCLTFYEQCFG